MNAREITEPDRKIENFVFPHVIGILDSADSNESNGITSCNGVKSNGEQSFERVMMLLMLTVGRLAVPMFDIWNVSLYNIAKCMVSAWILHH